MNNLAVAIHKVHTSQPVDWQTLTELERQVVAITAQLLALDTFKQREPNPLTEPLPYEWTVLPTYSLDQ